MGNCSFCGKPAGIFRSQHAECSVQYNTAIQQLADVAQRVAAGRGSFEEVEQTITSARENFVKADDVRVQLVRAWEAAVDEFLNDDLLDASEEKQLVAFQTHYELTQEALDRNGAYSRIVKTAVLRELMNGEIPTGVRVEGMLPFNFQKTEKLIWVFPATEYLEDKVRREYVGGSQGVSVRIAKGVYYRTGSFRGRPVERTERVPIDEGIVAVTDRHIYFGGPRKSFRIRHDKIVTHMPYSDGVGVVRDATTAKPQVFVTGDGWFTYNLLVNVAQL